MKPTRRGFLGTLAAIIAAPVALITPAKPVFATQDDLIKEAEKREDWFPCDVDLIDYEGNEMPVKAMYRTTNGYEVGDATFAKIGELKWKNHITVDCGTMTRSFGPIVALRLGYTKVLPKGYIAEVNFERVVNVGDGLMADWDIETNFD